MSKPVLPVIRRRIPAWPIQGLPPHGKHSVSVRSETAEAYQALAHRYGYTLEALIDRALAYWIENVREG